MVRRSLVEGHQDLVRRIASRIHDVVRPHVELDELISLGNTGLIEAAERFDAARNVPFPAFAYHRIRGAIYDGLRRMSIVPRRSYQMLRAARQAAAPSEGPAQRWRAVQGPDRAAPRHTAAEGLRDLYEALCGVATVYCLSLDTQVAAGKQPPSPPGERPDTVLARKRLRHCVMEAVRALPARERHFIEKCYFEGKSQGEAGAELGLSRSWSSRLHARAVDLLRAELRTLGVERPDDA